MQSSYIKYTGNRVKPLSVVVTFSYGQFYNFQMNIYIDFDVNIPFIHVVPSFLVRGFQVLYFFSVFSSVQFTFGCSQKIERFILNSPTLFSKSGITFITFSLVKLVTSVQHLRVQYVCNLSHEHFNR